MKTTQFIYKTFVATFFCVFFISCGSRDEMQEKIISYGSSDEMQEKIIFSGDVFGTYYSITYYSDNGITYRDGVDELLESVNQSVSYYRPGSVISKINNNDTKQVDSLFRRIYNRSVEIYEETNGAFDPTVSPLVNAWGFGFSERSTMSRQIVDSLLNYVGLHRTRLGSGGMLEKENPGIQFDFNAIAKGYAVDLVGEFLESKGITAYLVDIGGEVLANGRKPDGSKWKIAIENPAARYDDVHEFTYFLEIGDKALATSGSYRRYFEKDGKRYSHTIDPLTGHPVDHSLLSVTVIADDCMSADAYATAFMVMGFEKAIEFVEKKPDIEAFFIYSDGVGSLKTTWTSGVNPQEKYGD